MKYETEAELNFRVDPGTRTHSQRWDIALIFVIMQNARALSDNGETFSNLPKLAFGLEYQFLSSIRLVVHSGHTHSPCLPWVRCAVLLAVSGGRCGKCWYS